MMPFHVPQRLAHKWASPPSPNMNSIKEVITRTFSPIYFTIRSEVSSGPWNTDNNFYGLLCSAKFEGKLYSDMHKMVNDALNSVGMEGRCRFSVEPPSRWNVRSLKLCKHSSLETIQKKAMALGSGFITIDLENTLEQPVYNKILTRYDICLKLNIRFYNPTGEKTALWELRDDFMVASHTETIDFSTPR